MLPPPPRFIFYQPGLIIPNLSSRSIPALLRARVSRTRCRIGAHVCESMINPLSWLGPKCGMTDDRSVTTPRSAALLHKNEKEGLKTIMYEGDSITSTFMGSVVILKEQKQLGLLLRRGMSGLFFFYCLSEPPHHWHAGCNLRHAPAYSIFGFGETLAVKSGVRKDRHP